jgi:hypothetical protein
MSHESSDLPIQDNCIYAARTSRRHGGHRNPFFDAFANLEQGEGQSAFRAMRE